MASKQVSKSKKSSSPVLPRAVNSTSSSTSVSSAAKVLSLTSIHSQSSASSSDQGKPHYFYCENLPFDEERSKENVTVTVRFRPLSPREVRQGEEVAWYADGDTIVRSEHNPSLAYAYDRVFGPTTTTRHVYDVAAQHVVIGAMEGIIGTVFAYGVTSSGKTHTMHGDQRSPGIIPLAVKDAFGIIQETPSREFLLRVSYLEIYNEVVNDLLNPTGQNLRIREDIQGTFVEGIKEEVVLSPAHALSLIAAGEEHRHVGSNNFNLLSSRSHTIFTLTIESSPCDDNSEGEVVNLSQLNLIDLAGSESSKAETTGLRRKEGSYINKSLLTLGTVIAKLTNGKATHIPYRDSKLTRLLQTSLSGHGRVSLICTVTPSSTNMEETHNTLKFAHRAKQIEIQASQNKIIDEKSLIKKYQNEIGTLKEELEQLKRGFVNVRALKDAEQDDIFLLKQKLEDGQVRLKSRLEQEEEAKAALVGRIQRLTKLILVSTKATQSSRFPHRSSLRRRHSFGEEELAYLPYRRRDFIVDEENSDLYVSLERIGESVDKANKDEKKYRKHGLLNWFKLRKQDKSATLASIDGEKSTGTKSTTAPSTPQGDATNYFTDKRLSNNLITERSTFSTDLLMDIGQDREASNDNVSAQESPLTGKKMLDQIDISREQLKFLSGEVALHSSTLKCLSEEVRNDPKKEQIQMEMKRLNDEIKEKRQHMDALEKQMVASIQAICDKMGALEMSQSLTELTVQLNEKSFELEVKAADNRVIQGQLEQKISECEGLHETVASLKQQLSFMLEFRNANPMMSQTQDYNEWTSNMLELSMNQGSTPVRSVREELLLRAQILHVYCADLMILTRSDMREVIVFLKKIQLLLQSMTLSKESDEIEELKQRVNKLTEEKNQIEARNQKLAEDSAYAKQLASAAAVELKALSEVVSKLMHHNDKLTADMAALKNPAQSRGSSRSKTANSDGSVNRFDQVGPAAEVKSEQRPSHGKELAYEAALMEKEQREAELQKKVEESKQREAYLENEIANMHVMVAKLKKNQGNDEEGSISKREIQREKKFGAQKSPTTIH